MKTHSAQELRFYANILDSDGQTVLASGIGCGLENLTGRRLEQAQLIIAETSHMILMRSGDAGQVKSAVSYIQLDTGAGPLLYVVDYTNDPLEPRPNMWLEIFCHVERSNS